MTTLLERLTHGSRRNTLRRLLAAGAVLLALTMLAGTRAQAQTPRIFLFSPAGGESLVVDSTHMIRWSASNVTGKLRVEYSADSMATWKLIDTVTARPGTDSLAWRIPDDTTHTAFARVRTLDSTVRGRSQRAFSIVAAPVPRIRVLFPNGGELFAKDSLVNIRWSTENVVGLLLVELSLDSGATWTTLSTATARAGNDTMAWRVPADTTSVGLIRVRTTDGSVGDASNRTFSIREELNPAIVLSYPNGGEVFRPDSIVRVRWRGTDLSGQILAEYSIDSGATWKPIGNLRTARNGPDSLTWRIPNDTTARALVRLSTTSGSARDTSDAVFSIAGTPPPPAPSLSLLSPNGGGTYHADSTIMIRWMATNVTGTLFVEYSVDSLLTWVPITSVAAVAGRDSVRWQIPNDSSTTAFLRVRTADGALVARSTRAFTILPRPSVSSVDERRVAAAGLSVTPNPARGFAEARWSQSSPGIASLQVLDLLGRTLVATTAGSASIGAHVERVDVSSLSPGRYLLRITGKGAPTVMPIVVVR